MQHTLKYIKIIFILLLLAISCHNVHANENIGSFLLADIVKYDKDGNMLYALGNVKLAYNGYFFNADKLTYDINKDKLWVQGNVQIENEKKQIAFADYLIIQDKFKFLAAKNFITTFPDESLLVAQLANRINSEQINLFNANFTPCHIFCKQQPIWNISAQQVKIDYQKEKITYKNARFSFLGIPILFTPYFSHPTPKAKARSGILVPAINNNAINIPLYWRIKPNIDLTVSPRITTNYIIYDTEFRHKVKDGNYNLNSSYVYLPYIKKVNSHEKKSGKYVRYHIFSNGNFIKNGYVYGMDIKRTSDKAYLRNYHQDFSPFLVSKIFIHKVTQYDYFMISALNFQELRASKEFNQDTIILPHITTQNIINLNESESSYIIIKNNSLILAKNYKDNNSNIPHAIRSSTSFSLINNFNTDNGHLFSIAGYTRGDLYFISKNFENESINHKHNRNKFLTRNIPEIHLGWRYPLIANRQDANTMILEPIIKIVLGTKYHERYSQFTLLEATKYELNDSNLFASNRFDGIDNHEYGNRVSCGIQSTIAKDKNQYSAFLGRLINQDNTKNNGDYVGNLNISISDQLDLFYKFRKANNLKNIKDEIGTNLHYDNLNMSASFIKLNNLSKYYISNSRNQSNNNITQIYYAIDYALNQQWSFGHGMRIDISEKKSQIISQSFNITYLYDCIKVSSKFYIDNTSDDKRGLKKNFTKTISLNLKVLNM